MFDSSQGIQSRGAGAPPITAPHRIVYILAFKQDGCAHLSFYYRPHLIHQASQNTTFLATYYRPYSPHPHSKKKNPTTHKNDFSLGESRSFILNQQTHTYQEKCKSYNNKGTKQWATVRLSYKHHKHCHWPVYTVTWILLMSNQEIPSPHSNKQACHLSGQVTYQAVLYNLSIINTGSYIAITTSNSWFTSHKTHTRAHTHKDGWVYYYKILINIADYCKNIIIITIIHTYVVLPLQCFCTHNTVAVSTEKAAKPQD